MIVQTRCEVGRLLTRKERARMSTRTAVATGRGKGVE